MSQQLHPESTFQRAHGFCHLQACIATGLGVAGIVCFATGALVPLGVVLLLLAIFWGAFAWVLAILDKRYDQTHHYDITNE